MAQLFIAAVSRLAPAQIQYNITVSAGSFIPDRKLKIYFWRIAVIGEQ